MSLKSVEKAISCLCQTLFLKHSNYNINQERMVPDSRCSIRNHSAAVFLSGPPYNLITVCAVFLLVLTANATDITDNTCTFKVSGKLFTLAYLNMKANTTNYYTVKINDTAKVEFSFCEPFLPGECQTSTFPYSYSYLITQTVKDSSVITTCVPFSSSSKTANFNPQYLNKNGQIQLNLTMKTNDQSLNVQRSTSFLLDCEESTKASIQNITTKQIDENTLLISGKSAYACPLFEISSLWVALSDNKLIFGSVLLVVGFIMLFYGILMTHLMIFLAAYFLSFAALTGLFTAFLSPDSSRLAIYFSLLLILFISTLIAYALTRLVDVSIFLIGAFLGFIIATIVNTIFIKIFAIYSVWSMVAFSIIFMVPLGLLTFKYSQQIMVVSTSLTGAYMVVRPFSWLFGGFPNQFTLYQSIKSGEIAAMPWTVFIYFILIFGVFALGVLYQILKISRMDNEAQHTNYLPQGMQDRLDIIHQHVEKLINKYSKNDENKNEDYSKLGQGKAVRKSNQSSKGIEQISGEIELEAVKERKSKENDF